MGHEATDRPAVDGASDAGIRAKPLQGNMTSASRFILSLGPESFRTNEAMEAARECARYVESHRAEVERLTRERDHNARAWETWMAQCMKARKEKEAAESALAAAQKRVGELETALGFYAECEHWHVGGELIPASPHSEYKPDCGDTARAALAAAAAVREGGKG